jgi:2-methylaconitate cis-trans-isomerase PrpF
MASLYATGLGTTLAAATLVNPPGDVGGAAVGMRELVIDSIFVNLQSTAGTTGGTISIRRDASIEIVIASAIALAATTSKEINITFPNGGLRILNSAGSAMDVSCGAAAMTISRVLVAYHYE